MHHFGFLTPLLWCAVAFVAIQLRHRRKMERIRLGQPDPRDSYTPSAPPRGYEPTKFTSTSSEARNNEQRELEALRERVKVLERIATEDRKTHELAQEIEALRDR